MKLFARLLLLAFLVLFASTCNVSNSNPDTLSLHLDDSLKASNGKYDSLQIAVYVINGQDTSYHQVVFHDAYTDSTQLLNLSLPNLPSNNFIVILSGYHAGTKVLVMELPFSSGQAGATKKDTLVVHIASPTNDSLTNQDSINVIWSVNGKIQTQQMTQDLTGKTGKVMIFRSFTDSLGNTERDSVSVIVDRTPPNVKITSPKSGFLTNSDSVTVTWTVDSTAQHTRTSESLLGTQGSITITRDSSDAVGNRGVDSVIIRRDTLPPNPPTFTSSSSATITNQTQPKWVWKSGGNGGMGTFRYSFNNQPAVTITDTLYQPANPLADGKYPLTVAERDSAGNWSLADSLAITVQTKGPLVKITTPAPGFLTNGDSVAVIWSVNNVVQSTRTYESLVGEQGSIPIIRDSTDVVGNRGVDSVIIRRDTVPPNPPLFTSSSSPKITNQPLPKWVWKTGGNGGMGTFRYSFNNQPAVTITDPLYQPTNPLADGKYSLTVAERDSAGNWSLADSLAITVQTKGPIVLISSPVNNALTNQNSIGVTWTVNGVNQSQQLTEDLTSKTGAVAITRSFTDSLGNTGKDSVSINVDHIPPNNTLVRGVGPTNNPKPTWTWHTGGGGGNGLYRFKLDTMNLTSDTTGHLDTSYTSATNLSEGRHVLFVEERDQAGNWSALDSGTAQVDLTAPLVKIISPASGFLTNGNTVTVTWTVYDVVQSTRISESLVGRQAAITITRDSTDAAGNRGVDSVIIRRDTIPPDPPIFMSSSSATNTNQTRPKWVWKSGGNGGMGIFRYSFNNQTAVIATDTLYQPTNPLANGKYSLTVAERDSAGNWSPTDSLAISVKTWVVQDSGTQLTSVSFTDTNNGWAVGPDGVILHTNNGGAAWSKQTLAGGLFLESVYFTDENNGWAVGDEGNRTHTTNGGATWSPQGQYDGFVGSATRLYSVYFTDANNGWAAGVSNSAYAILQTANGGAIWSVQTRGTMQNLYSVNFTDANHGWAVGSSGLILNTTNGGAMWSPQTSGITQSLFSVNFTDPNNGWAVGSSGLILHTTNGGATWSPQTSGTTQNLNSVYFPDGNNGWAVGGSGIILHTTNGGATWSTQTSGTTQNLNSVHFINANTGWVVGDGGVILSTGVGP